VKDTSAQSERSSKATTGGSERFLLALDEARKEASARLDP
jgi:hypothetical protein